MNDYTAGTSAWMAGVARNDRGATMPSLANALLVLRHDIPILGMLAWNSFTAQHLIMHAAPAIDAEGRSLAGPYPRPWAGEDVALVQAYLQRNWDPRFNRATTEEAMAATAALNRFHPVTHWLDGLEWDRWPRLDTWLSITFGVEGSDYHTAVGSKFLMAAVRRVRHPGCKFDHMPVFEGPQGLGKSRTMRALFGAPWFSDDIPADLADKDAAMALRGVWGLEFAEIEHLIRVEIETLKAFLSRQVDRYRPPYGKFFVDWPRQGVMFGTTNADDYLRDTSGNRRIWPVRCITADMRWIEANRGQLWAEAAHREAREEEIWLDDDVVREDAADVQAERMAEDLWLPVVEEWLRLKEKVHASDVLAGAVGLERGRQGKREEMRVGAILKGLGWERRTMRDKEGKPRKMWVFPERFDGPELSLN